MSRDEIYEALTNIFREIFNDKNIVLNNEICAQDIRGWDSFNHINLMMAVEEGFGIRMKNSEITHLKNVGELVGLIETKKR